MVNFMEPISLWITAFSAALCLGIHGGFFGALADACLKIGMGLENATAAGKTGFQDAITPPSSTNARLLNWLLTLILFIGSWYFLNIGGLLAIFATRVAVPIFPGALLKADPPKPVFCRMIYHSMTNRQADYEQAGDYTRANAMEELRLRFERSSFAQKLI